MDIQSFIPRMPEVDEYRDSLNSLSDRWNLLTLLGQMSNIGMDMTETQDGFQKLTDRLLERLANETLVKLTSEMEAKAQVAVDIVIRNLFERTADIGFLATDDDIRSYIKNISNLDKDDNGRQQAKQHHNHIVERFREYVAKYSVYNNIILLNTKGTVLAQLDESNPVSYSHDSLIQEVLNSNQDYVESYRFSDLQPEQSKSLIYSFRVTESNDQDSQALGVLCLIFRFENEMEGVFHNLIAEDDWMEITLLDDTGVVISSSDPYHIPLGAKLAKILDKDFKVVRFAGREYLATTCATQGYEGYFGLGWFGHVMVPLDSAFSKIENASSASIDKSTMGKLVSASSLFSDDLIDIPRQADRIQRELDVTVWNGNVQIANTNSGENSFSKSLLNQISITGERTKQVFENSISNLNQTVISSFLDDAAFHALLAVDIMDRNLYERANDCRWWALTSDFRDILAKENINEADRLKMNDILAYINNLYTVYTNLFLYDKSGTIQAVSKADEKHLLGSKLSETWVTQALNIRDSQDYSVSPFMTTPLYHNQHTYIYGTSITHRTNSEVLGGIGVVFDAQPQFQQMLLDALPKNEKGEIIKGCFGLFIDRNKNIISSTHENYQVGSTLSIEDRFVKLDKGTGSSDIIEMDGCYYVVGARMSAGYREYKVSDNYHNDLVALVFVEIGSNNNVDMPKQRISVNHNFRYPKVQGTEKSIELSTFLVNERLFAMESASILCSLNGQEITPILGSDETYLGVISIFRKTIPVVSLRSCLGGKNGYDKENDSIIITRMLKNDDSSGNDEYMGLVIDRVQDSPEIPVRCLDRCNNILSSNSSLISYIVHPESGEERSEMLSVLDTDAVRRSILKKSGQNNQTTVEQHLLPSP